MALRHSRVLAIAGAMLAWVAVRPLAAQHLRGTVALPDSATPARGVIVVATATDGATIRRALTNQRGGFDLPLPRAGRYVVSVLRIGFRPTFGPTVDLAADETRSLRIVLGAGAISLARITVRGQDQCRTRPDSGALVARAWEEARKALMASQLSALDAPLVAQWIVYDRSLDASAKIVREQTVTTTTAPTTHAFKSWPAESLAARGYVVVDGEITTHYAPDADVLLSESFASQHCFRLEPPSTGRDELVGVGFRPAREERGRLDIEGTFWLDRATAELRWLDYRYTPVPAPAERAGVGGKVEFLRLTSGSWLVSRWNIRMAKLGAPDGILSGSGVRRVIGAQPSLRSVTVAPPEPSLRAVFVAGGQVTHVLRGDSLVYEAAGARFDAQLVSKDTLVPVAGATIALTGSDYATQADASGRAHIAPVLEGRYRARVQTALMEAIGASFLDREVEVREGVTRVDSIVLPVADELLRLACGSGIVKRDDVTDGKVVIHLTRSDALLYGTVRDSSGRPAAHAAVTISWQADYKTLVTEIAMTEHARGVLTDEVGRWRLCGVPTQRPLRVRVVTDAGAAERTTRIEEGAAFAATDLVLHRLGAAAAGGPLADARVVLEISVSDRDGAPLPDVTLELTPQGAPSRKIVTSEHGRSVVVNLEPGTLHVRARAVGYKAGEVAVAVARGRNTMPIILDKVRLPTLDTVRVMGDRVVLARHAEFEARRLRHEATASITEEDIQKRHPSSTWQMLTNVSTLNVSDRSENGNNVVVATSRRALVSGIRDEVPCFMQVVIDGIPVAPDPTGRVNLGDLPPPSSIHGIEVFAGPATVPLQYKATRDGAKCGLIAIWTK